MEKPKDYTHYRKNVKYSEWPQECKDYVNCIRFVRKHPEYKHLSLDEVKEKIKLHKSSEFRSKLAKEGWDNKTEESKEAFRKRQTEIWYEKSDEEKADKISKLNKGSTEFWNELDKDPEKRDRFCKYRWDKRSDKEVVIKRLTDAGTNYMKSLSKDELKKKMDYIRNIHLEKLQTDEDYRLKFISQLRMNNEKFWHNATEEEKEIIYQKRKEAWDNLSEEEKNKKINELTNSYIDWWNNLSNEEKENHIKITKNNFRLWYDNPENNAHEVLSEKAKEVWNNRPEEQKEEISYRLRNMYNNLTEEEKIEWSNRTGKIWQDMSVQDFQNIFLNRAYKNNNSIITDTRNKTEIEFINILNNLMIQYKFQYYNILINEEWNDKFHTNPITKSKFVSPYHCWDFLIKTKKKNILVDVDGSIHKPGTMLFKVPDYNCTVRELIDFNDSQRPYQTDGLDAYIIECHDDALNYNNTVIKVNDGSKSTVKDFINLLNFYNNSDEIMKKYK